MNNGVLLFAFDNEEINYIKQAEECARRVKRFLNLPVALVTDKTNYKNKLFSHILYEDENNSYSKRIYMKGNNGSSVLTFRNTVRSRAYELTPFNKTLVMDTDYMLCSNDLASAFDIPKPFQIYKNATDIHPERLDTEFKFLSPIGPDFYWATVFCFEKTEEVKMFFDLLKLIQENYSYYVNLYKLHNEMFRNDYLFSIAINILGNDFVSELPGKMYYSLDKDIPIKLTDTDFSVVSDANRLKLPITIKNSDIHVMNKYWLEANI